MMPTTMTNAWTQYFDKKYSEGNCRYWQKMIVALNQDIWLSYDVLCYYEMSTKQGYKYVFVELTFPPYRASDGNLNFITETLPYHKP